MCVVEVDIQFLTKVVIDTISNGVDDCGQQHALPPHHREVRWFLSAEAHKPFCFIADKFLAKRLVFEEDADDEEICTGVQRAPRGAVCMVEEVRGEGEVGAYWGFHYYFISRLEAAQVALRCTFGVLLIVAHKVVAEELVCLDEVVSCEQNRSSWVRSTLRATTLSNCHRDVWARAEISPTV